MPSRYFRSAFGDNISCCNEPFILIKLNIVSAKRVIVIWAIDYLAALKVSSYRAESRRVVVLHDETPCPAPCPVAN